jgi:hypothetical protein
MYITNLFYVGVAVKSSNNNNENTYSRIGFIRFFFLEGWPSSCPTRSLARYHALVRYK